MSRVEWLHDALEELASLWLEADSSTRGAIVAATRAIDQELQLDPGHRGESREAGVRVLFSYPLAVLFEVDPRQRIAWVLHVWRFRRRGE